ncbi:MAG TPA: DNA ligase D [Alphaproteobacteria bacterium]|nr:DNA ligase D [Alphaproteobacteria bacterium]
MAEARTRTRRTDNLARYRAMRDFKKTSEPQGGRPTPRGNSFVVQKHAARRLHYDFRLELDGTLKSWAVTRGPSFDPADKRLAVHVEDHPIDYGGFEGIIPQGEYGGGTVMVWDRGTWEPIGDPRAGYAAGKLKFRLNGKKLKGGWTLVRMGGRARAERRENWLLIKERDEEARPGRGDETLERQAKSVATGRSMEQIAASADRVWTRDGEQPARPKAATPQPKAAPTRKKKRGVGGLPDFVPPELPTLVDQPPDGPEWLHEIKLDGYRVLWRIADGKSRFLTRTGQDWTERFPELAKLRLKADTALVDGEIVATDGKGVSSFQALQEALSEGRTADLKFCAFDLLYLDGEDLQKLPLEARKTRLKALLRASSSSDRLAFSEHIDGRGKDVYVKACGLSLEGIVSKRRGAPYRPGRGEDWLKTKCAARQEFVIGGFTEHSKVPGSIGALLLGYYEDEEFIYAGKVGTGFDSATRKQLRRELNRVARRDMPFRSVPTAARRGAHWVEPQLVAEIAYSNWTRDGVLRHPSFQGLRMDKPAPSISRDKPKPVTKSAKPAARAVKGGTDEIAGVVLTHPARVLYAEQGLTKRDLAAYYVAVADAMLPHLAGRPLSLVRCPEGEGKACFYQKHPGNSAPPALRRIKIEEGSGTNEYVVVDDAAGLVALVQMGVLEIHPWGSREKHLEKPDRIIFDFDPAPDVDWSRVVAATAEMRERLRQLGLESFLKTTGGKGLHVVAPIAPRQEWPEVKAFTKALAAAMEHDTPGAYTTVMSKRERRGKIFIDYLRNDRGSTAIAPYSTRARAGAPVAMPIPWAALKPSLKPSDLTVLTVPKRLKAARSNPWAEIDKLRQGITAKARAAVGLK